MTTRAQLRKASLALPEVTEHVDDRVRRYVVEEAEFVRCDAADVLTIALPTEEATALIQRWDQTNPASRTDPTIFGPPRCREAP